MWLLTIAPSWLFSLAFFLSIVVLLVAKTLKVLPYNKVFEIVAVSTLALSVYFSGAKWVDQHWRERAQALELQVKELQAKSAEQNTKIVERVVTKRETVRERGEDIIKYVDRVVVKDNEVVKYVEHCPKLPREIVDTINKAAKP